MPPGKNGSQAVLPVLRFGEQRLGDQEVGPQRPAGRDVLGQLRLAEQGDGGPLGSAGPQPPQQFEAAGANEVDVEQDFADHAG